MQAAGTGPPGIEQIDRRLERLATQPFRAKFHLRGRERGLVEQKGLRTVRRHGADPT